VRNYVKLVASWLGVDNRTALLLLTADEVECLAVEALCRRAVWS
jgi:hypothetical protein